jgi:addiction module HigA family antidote
MDTLTMKTARLPGNKARIDTMYREQNDQTPEFAIHPGEVLKAMLEDRGWTQREFAERIGRPVRLVNKIINGHSGITHETARDFALAFEMSQQFWLNLESKYRVDLELIRRRQRKIG